MTAVVAVAPLIRAGEALTAGNEDEAGASAVSVRCRLAAGGDVGGEPDILVKV